MKGPGLRLEALNGCIENTFGLDVRVRKRARKRGRAPFGVAEYLVGSPRNVEKGRRVEPLRLAVVADKKVVKDFQRWTPELESRVDSDPASLPEEGDAAIPAWVAEECNRAFGRELTQKEDK